MFTSGVIFLNLIVPYALGYIDGEVNNDYGGGSGW